MKSIFQRNNPGVNNDNVQQIALEWGEDKEYDGNWNGRVWPAGRAKAVAERFARIWRKRKTQESA